MPAEIRKTLLHVEKTLIEGNRPAKKPLVLIAAAAVFFIYYTNELHWILDGARRC